MHDLLSAPSEKYEDHIDYCLQSWTPLTLRFLPSLSRLFREPHEEINRAVSWMLFSHDIGKLTYKWQDGINSGKKPPPHAAMGAAYLLEQHRAIGLNSDLVHAFIFAVLIHHVDSGIVGNNLESPDAQAILHGLTGGGGETIIWHEAADNVVANMVQKHKNILGPNNSGIPLKAVTLKSLRDLSDLLRNWSKHPKLLDQHRHRMLGSSLHHVLKVCDWRAAVNRQSNDNEKEARHSILECLLYGGLQV